MSAPLPRVKKKTRNTTLLVWVLALIALALGGVVVYMVITQVVNPAQPASLADRDMQLIRTQLQKTPKDPTLLARLAELEYQKGQIPEALRDGQMAVRYAGDTPTVRLQYAGILLREHRPADAKALAQAEINLPTTDTEADAYFILGQADWDLKDQKGALAAMLAGIKRAPVAADERSLYADMLRDSGNKKDAITQYKQVLLFLPGDSHATGELKKLGVTTPSVSTTSSPHSSAPTTSGKK